MNYDEARQLKDGGWHWTTMNDGQVRTATPCIQHIGDESDPLWYMGEYRDEDWKRCDPHATREEAERHFYDHSLSQLRDEESEAAYRCETPNCGTWTNRALGNRQEWFYFRAIFLCDQHRTRAMVEQLHPFKAGVRIIHS